MKKVKYNNGEEILIYTLENGIKVYLYPTKKTKNFYITVSTHFGSEVMKYKSGDKVYDVTLGSAHFLEHRVMDFTKNKEAMEKINEYGSLVNAYTTYNGTNFNIFGNTNIEENMHLLFDRVFKANIKSEDVESERGIILEEYNMYFDDPYFILYNNLYESLFESSYIKYPVIGTPEGIKTVSASELNRLYKDFYKPRNMFIVVCGNFEEGKVIDYIEEYMKGVKDTGKPPKVIKVKEKMSVVNTYKEVNLDVFESKVAVGYKMPTIVKYDDYKTRIITTLIMSNLFSSTGDAEEELQLEGINRNSFGLWKADDYLLIYFKASTNDSEKFINIIEKYLSNIKITKSDLERKKRGLLASLILGFEDICEVEDKITSEVLTFNKLLEGQEELVKSITLEEVKEVIKAFDFSNRSVVKVCK